VGGKTLYRTGVLETIISIFHKTEISISQENLAKTTPFAQNLPHGQTGNPCFNVQANKVPRESIYHSDKSETPTTLVTAQDLGKVTA
jgi:hypothetical protein